MFLAMSALVSVQAAVQKVERHVADACSKGAEIACGGARHTLGGLFYQPTVLLGCVCVCVCVCICVCVCVCVCEFFYFFF